MSSRPEHPLQLCGRERGVERPCVSVRAHSSAGIVSEKAAELNIPDRNCCGEPVEFRQYSLTAEGKLSGHAHKPLTQELLPNCPLYADNRVARLPRGRAMTRNNFRLPVTPYSLQSLRHIQGPENPDGAVNIGLAALCVR